MKIILKTIIRLYWFFIPGHWRRNCIYRTSCSKHVYEITDKSGWRNGIRAFAERYQTCRPGYEVIFLPKENQLLVKLTGGRILQEHELAPDLVQKHKLFHS